MSKDRTPLTIQPGKIRIPLPDKAETTFKDKSRYNRSIEKRQLKKILQDTKYGEELDNNEEYRDIVTAAMENTGYMSGGMDIMKKLIEEQSGRKIDKSFTNGFGILQKWQKQKQKNIKNPVSEPDGEGFDIMKKIVKNPTPINI